MQEFATTEYNIFLQAILDAAPDQLGSAFGTSEDNQLPGLMIQYGISEAVAQQILVDVEDAMEQNQ